MDSYARTGKSPGSPIPEFMHARMETLYSLHGDLPLPHVYQRIQYVRKQIGFAYEVLVLDPPFALFDPPIQPIAQNFFV